MIVIGVIAIIVVVLFVLDRIDTAKCNAQKAVRRVQVTTLAQVSRAKSLDDCPPEFLAMLAEALDAQDGDVPSEKF